MREAIPGGHANSLFFLTELEYAVAPACSGERRPGANKELVAASTLQH